MIDAATMQALMAHRDAGKAAAEPEQCRPTGLQRVEFYPSGLIVVLYHWGRRTFRGQEELMGWLRGEIPRSWQE